MDGPRMTPEDALRALGKKWSKSEGIQVFGPYKLLGVDVREIWYYDDNEQGYDTAFIVDGKRDSTVHDGFGELVQSLNQRYLAATTNRVAASIVAVGSFLLLAALLLAGPLLKVEIAPIVIERAAAGLTIFVGGAAFFLWQYRK